jgi:hypothetical protein
MWRQRGDPWMIVLFGKMPQRRVNWPKAQGT